MKAKTLGEKVRAARREMHLTQSALCGDFMTRNMLSRIETGDINPSLETLRFLAERLNVPAGYLLSDQDNLAEYRRPAIMEELRARYRAGDWEGVRALAETEAPDDDETNLILCECAVRLGVNAYRSGKPEEASACFEKALSCAERTVYRTGELLSEAVLYQGILAGMRGVDPTPYYENCRRYFRASEAAERYILTLVLAAAEGGEPARADMLCRTCLQEDRAGAALAHVWILAAQGQEAEALPLLTALLENGAFSDDPELLLRCMRKTEALAAAADDYKTAYQYAKKREQLADRLGAADPVSAPTETIMNRT